MNMKCVATVYTCETINDIKYTRRLYVPMFYETQWFVYSKFTFSPGIGNWNDDWWYWDQANKITKYSEFKSDLEDV